MRLSQFKFAWLVVLLLTSSNTVAAPATIDTSTVATATSNSAQRKTFFDTLNNTHWAFYYNGTAIEYSYSADGESWTSAGTLPYDTASFSAVYKTIAGTSYVFVVAEANSYDVVLRRGVLNATSITFDAEIIVFDGTSTSNLYQKPTATITGNNHLWMSAIEDHGADKFERFQVTVRRSTNVADNDLTALNAATLVGRRIHSLENAVLVPRSGDEVYVVASADDSKIVGYAFDGIAWSAANAGGDYSWFGFGGKYGVNDYVNAIAVSGSEVYIGGNFNNAGGVAAADRIAKWDGTSWSALGSGLNNNVYSIAINGSDIYVGGSFTDAGGNGAADYIARWDGHTWNALSNGVSSTVYAIAISGNDIYVGGNFTDAGGDGAADYIARWDGAAWNAVGSGLDNLVTAIAISGSDIYVGGNFSNAGGNGAADFIARWDGATWNALGSGLNNSVTSIAISGSDIYVGGWFTDAGGNGAADYIASWDGATWNALGSGLSGAVTAIAISGNDVYVGGIFTDAGGNGAADRIARWDGAIWNALDSGFNSYPNAIIISGSDVYVGGSFVDAGGITDADYIAKWNGVSWNALSLPAGGINGTVYAVKISGNDIYVGGNFTDAGGVAEADGIARWDGVTWNALGNGINGTVSSIAISGNDIYIGGTFSDVGGIANADNIVRWDGASWNALGSGLNSSVSAIGISGSDIYVGGWFTDAGGIAAGDRIARWNGTSWNALGSGISGGGFPRVQAIAISGSDVYVGGSFSSAGGVASTLYIARWNGTSWNAVGGGLISAVYAIAISGSDVYVGGTFQNAGGNANADCIARWNGTSWNALGNGVNNTVNAIAISGSDIYIGGGFAPAGGVAGAGSFARWDGSTWNAVGGGLNIAFVNTYINAITISGGDIYVGSSFFAAQGLKYPTPLAYYSQAIASDADSTTEISATSDANGDVYLSYTDDTDQVKFRRFDESDAAWDATVTLNATVSTSPSITYKDSDGRVTASWVESNSVNFSHALTPYLAADWSAEDTHYNTGTNVGVTTAAHQETADLPVVWTSGVGNPYSVLAAPIDMSAPTVVITSSATSSTSVSPIPVTITFNKDVTGFVVGDITVGNGTAGNFVAVDGATYTADITPTGQGSVTVDVAGSVAVDAFANNNTAATQLTRTYDTVGPGVVISSGATNPTNSSPFSVTFQFDETVTGFVVGDITVGNGTAGNFVAVDGDTYTADITPTGQGAVTVDVAGTVAIDGAGNDNTAATQLTRTYDSVGPGVAISSGATNPTNSSPFSVTFQFDETVTGFVVGDITVGNGTAGNFVAVDGDTYTADITPTGQGAVTVDVAGSVAIDGAGNDNTAATQLTRTYDTVGPGVAISTGATNPTNSSPFSVTFQFDETVTGFVVGDITVGNGAAGNFVAVDGDTYTADITPTGDGVVTVDVAGSVAADAAGNDNTAATQLVRTYDNTIPTVTIANITNPINLSNRSAFPITGSCSENGRTVTLGATSSAGGAAVSTTATCGAGTWSKSLNLTGLNDATITFTADLDDAVGLDAVQASRTATKDTVVPTGVIATTSSSPTNITPIPITIEFSETVTGFAASDFSVTNGYVTNLLAVDGDSYTANLVPSANGTVTVVLGADKVADIYDNGNTTTNSVSVVFDSSSPLVTISSTESSPTTSKSIPLKIQFSEDVSGFTKSDITVTNGSLSGFTATSASIYEVTLKPKKEGDVTVNIAADAAEDENGNGNSAAAQYSISYEDRLICSVWNGFFSGEDQLVWNILEHVNLGTKNIGIQATLYSWEGEKKSSAEFTVEPGQQLDLLAHDMPGWIPDSYGLVCSKVVSGDPSKLDGRMVYYKRQPLGGFEYIFASPFTDGYAGEQYVGFNTYQPSLSTQDTGNFVANWIQITNLDKADQKGKLLFYNQEGELLQSKSITIKGRGQSDNSAHDWDGPTVGFVEWKPNSESAKFIVKNTRYLYDNALLENSFDGVFQLQASQGEKGVISAILDTAGASSVLEVANIRDKAVQTRARFYSSEGALLAELNFELPAHGSQHIVADSILTDGTGSVLIDAPGATKKTLTATVFQYGRVENGGIAYLYGVSGIKPAGEKLRGSYNTFLNQSCDIYLANSSSTAQTATISMQRNNGSEVFSNSVITLEPKESMVSNICSAESEESYGVVTLDAGNPGVINSYLLRRDINDSYRYPIPVR